MATIILITVGSLGLVWCCTLYLRQDSLIYYPRGYAEVELDNARSRAVQLEYATGAGKQVAFYVPGREEGGKKGAPERIWVVFGGNGDRALSWLSLGEDLGVGNAGFLLVDYPGYGLCEGKPSPETIEESAAGAVAKCAEYLGMSVGEASGRMAVMGHSLGAAAALMTAEKFGIERVILMSPFTSMKDVASRVVGRPLANIVRHEYDNRARIARLLEREGVEITIIHGMDDKVIPAEMGRALAEMDPERIRYHAVRGADHNDLLWHAAPILSEAMRR